METIDPGLIMVKPHAYGQVLDIVIASLLKGNPAFGGQLCADDPLREVIPKISVKTSLIRDLSSLSYGDELFSLFYSDKVERRYFPLMREWYLGKVAFLPYVFRGDPQDHSRIFDALKGTTATYDSNGSAVTAKRGLRGLLGLPYAHVDNGSVASLDEQAYRRVISPVINNYVHLCDSHDEISSAYELLGLQIPSGCNNAIIYDDE